MTDELIEQLRARNPAPVTLPPPPIDEVLARIARAEGPAASRWPRWARWSGPSLAIAVAAAVAVVALVSLHGAHHHAVAPAGRATKPTATATARPGPGEAMHGALQSPVLGFGSGDAGVIAWTQFRTPTTSHPKPWLATTSDGGRSWSVQRTGFSLFADPVFDGPRDGWAQAIDPSRALNFYVTHDGGRDWRPAASAAAANSVNGDVSVAGGVVWAVGTGSCSGSSCSWIVMHGPASGDRLAATAAQPQPPTDQNATTISAGSATTAYVSAPAHHRTVVYATHDGGRHWHQLSGPCSDASSPFQLTATSPDSLWRVCIRAKQFFAARSTDGGARWSSQPLPFIPLYAFQPVSTDVAWSQDIHGTIYRTADGGATWQPVWRSVGAHGRPIAGFSPILSADNSDDASLLVQLRRGPISRDQVPRSTNLVVYRTSDAGRSWTPNVVKLPRG